MGNWNLSEVEEEAVRVLRAQLEQELSVFDSKAWIKQNEIIRLTMGCYKAIQEIIKLRLPRTICFRKNMKLGFSQKLGWRALPKSGEKARRHAYETTQVE